jgi:formylmethanofuran dehydrogenase subunit E
MKRVCLYIIVVSVFCLGIVAVLAGQVDDDHVTDDHDSVHSSAGDNPWNQGQPPEDWWGEIKRTHGHVGPWNVLGWRIGQEALHEFNVKWGRHDLDIICYIPMTTPYSCMADGLVIGTGNCIGRLDIRLAEVMSLELVHVAVRRKDGSGPVLIFRPNSDYLRRIKARKVHELEKLSRQCLKMKENDLFTIERLHVGITN